MVCYWRVSKRMAQLVDAGGNVLAVVERCGQREWAGVTHGAAFLYESGKLSHTDGLQRYRAALGAV